jgi:hypothetical protein
MKRYSLHTVLCISIALSLLIASIHLPARHAEAFVKPAVKIASSPMVKEAVAAFLTYHILSQKQPNVVQACTRMFPAQNKSPNLCSPPANPTLLTMQAQVFTYVAWACPTLMKACLEKLNGKATTLLNTIENSLRKNPMAFDEMCRVLQTLLGMTIREYCEANGKGIPSISSTSGSVAPPKNPPKGGSGKTTAGFGGIPHNFLSKLTAQLSKTVNDLLENCPAWLEQIVPLCQKSKVFRVATPATTTNKPVPPKKDVVKSIVTSAMEMLLYETPDPKVEPVTFHLNTYKLHQLLAIFVSKRESDEASIQKTTKFIEGILSMKTPPKTEEDPLIRITPHMLTFMLKHLKEINTLNARKYIEWLKETYESPIYYADKKTPENLKTLTEVSIMKKKSDLYDLLNYFTKIYNRYLGNFSSLEELSIKNLVTEINNSLGDIYLFVQKQENNKKPYRPLSRDFINTLFPDEKFKPVIDTFTNNTRFENNKFHFLPKK